MNKYKEVEKEVNRNWNRFNKLNIISNKLNI